jgi:hypothetical protein
MGIWIRKISAVASAVALAVLVVSFAAPSADAKEKSIQTEAKWVSFDPAAKTVTVKVRKTGKKSKDKDLVLKKGKEATFNVIPDGSILTKTSVAINGKRGALSEIPEGKTVNVYWRADENAPGHRFAKKIDVILSEEELEERFKPTDD